MTVIDRCEALDMDGKQCQKKATRTAETHLHNEIYGGKWVKTKLCLKCRKQLHSSDSFVVQKKR